MKDIEVFVNRSEGRLILSREKKIEFTLISTEVSEYVQDINGNQATLRRGGDLISAEKLVEIISTGKHPCKIHNSEAAAEYGIY